MRNLSVVMALLISAALTAQNYTMSTVYGYGAMPRSALSVVASGVPSSPCGGSDIALSASASGGSGNYTYRWSSTPAGFSSTLQNPSVSPWVLTTYTVTVSDGNTTASAVYSAVVTEVSTPTISIVGNSLAASHAHAYQWYWNGTLVTGANSQFYTPTGAGDYQVRAIDITGCISQPSALFTTTDIHDVLDTGLWAIGPNPTNGKLLLSGSLFETENISITTTDPFGNIVSLPKGTRQIDFSDQSAGFYCLLGKVNGQVLFCKRVAVVH